MSLIGWILLGLLAGFIASKLIDNDGENLLFDLGLGCVGAVLGGLLFSLFGASGVTGLNLHSLIVSVIGAVVALALYHLLIRRRVL
jgi:uncharacterized membrane protein YeaQ/YmgE (transglycosylase-associated protein family)